MSGSVNVPWLHSVTSRLVAFSSTTISDRRLGARRSPYRSRAPRTLNVPLCAARELRVVLADPGQIQLVERSEKRLTRENLL
jgi:hypothetical protein